jgi:hypothetical protein
MNAPWLFAVVGVITTIASVRPTQAQDAYRLQEKLPVGSQYRVLVRVDLSGTLTPPPIKDKAVKPLAVRGESAIEYDERVLTISPKGEATKTVRFIRRMDFKRSVGGKPQQTTWRPAVRRLVLLRKGNTEVPFSPDGPLTWGEIDQVRTDVFTPALNGLLPEKAVRVGDRWTAAMSAIQELTDMEKVDEGRLDFRLDAVQKVDGHRVAKASFVGTVRGTNEDGPNRQKLQGHLLFDLDGGYLSYLLLNGKHSLLNKDGKEVGLIEGRFVLLRERPIRSEQLADASLRGVKLEPDAANTLMLYDNAEMGLRFVHPRRWRVGAVRGTQVTLDGADGTGVLLTVDPLSKVPTAAAYLTESRAWLVKQKATIGRVLPPAKVQGGAGLEHFALEAKIGEEKTWMEYYVARQAKGGVSVAARLPQRDQPAVRRELANLARSLTVTKMIEDKK